MDVSAFIPKLIDLAIQLKNTIFEIKEVQKSEKRVKNALSEEVGILEKSIKRIYEFENTAIDILDSLGEYPSLDQLNDVMNLCAEAMYVLSEMINSYFRYSIAVKQLSNLEYLMSTLKKHKGMLFDYVMSVSETVIDDNQIIISGNFYRFIKAYEEEILPALNNEEAEKMEEKTRHYLDIMKNKVIPIFLSQKPRVLFRPKRIKRIYLEPMKQLISNQKKIKVDISEDKLRELRLVQSSPIFIVYEEIIELENQINKQQNYHIDHEEINGNIFYLIT